MEASTLISIDGSPVAAHTGSGRRLCPHIDDDHQTTATIHFDVVVPRVMGDVAMDEPFAGLEIFWSFTLGARFIGSKWFTGGVCAAPRGRIQFDFGFEGVRYRPTIRRPPSEANLRRARERLDVIKKEIELGTFSFDEEFPDYRFLRRIRSLPPGSSPTWTRTGHLIGSILVNARPANGSVVLAKRVIIAACAYA